MKLIPFTGGKTLLAYAALLGVLFLNSGAGCGKSDDPQPDNFQSLVGKWQAQSAIYNITRQDGSTLQTGPDFTKNGVVIVWEFFSDGRLRATEGGNSREVRWKLTVKQADPNGDIDDATLAIIGDEERDFAQLIGQSGDLTYDFATIKHSSGATDMYLTVDVTTTGPYKKNILVYKYRKL